MTTNVNIVHSLGRSHDSYDEVYKENIMSHTELHLLTSNCGNLYNESNHVYLYSRNEGYGIPLNENTNCIANIESSHDMDTTYIQDRMYNFDAVQLLYNDL